MTEDIYIVAGNTCEVNLDVEGEYILHCVSITGRLAITTVDASKDYIKYMFTDTSEAEVKAAITCRSTVSSALIGVITNRVCSKNTTDNLFYYNYDITDCSNNMKYLLGIKNLPAEKGTTFQAQPSLNGPTFFQVVCDKLAGCGVLTCNSFIVNSMFELSGPSYVGDMTNVVFAIRGIYDEDIEFDDDLLWHFQLEKLPSQKPGKNDTRESRQKNADMRMVLQYGK